MILLDTHAVVWLGLEPRRLSRRAAAAIRRAERSGGAAIASISLWEIALAIARGQLSAQGTPEAWIKGLLERTRVVVKDLTPEIAVLANQFPEGFPNDPADRLIAATARAEGLPLVTRDERIRASVLVQTIW